ncbi:MAG: type II toxin-antitoxin system prevent-host-death family antitoxin [Chromatiales bacterium]
MTITRWQIQKAKNRLSEVVGKAREEGSQVITSRGDEAVDAEEYRRLSRRAKESLVDLFRRSPLVGVDLEFTRSRDAGRDVRI